MTVISANDLALRYSWTAVPPDNPRLTGAPDSSLLNRSEGYEVLSFINRFCAQHTIDGRPMGKFDALKVERMIQAHPAHIRGQQNVKTWIKDNWSSY